MAYYTQNCSRCLWHFKVTRTFLTRFKFQILIKLQIFSLRKRTNTEGSLCLLKRHRFCMHCVTFILITWRMTQQIVAQAVTMAVVEENWQSKCSSIADRTTFIFNKELVSDVKFVVPASSDESESKKVIPAHKFVLAISSPVFYAMFRLFLFLFLF